MTARGGANALAATLLAVLGCASRSEPESEPASARLPSGVLARVAGSDVRSETVERIARSRSLPLPAARELALQDAVLGAAARRALPAGTERTLERAVLARALLEALAREAADRGEPTAAEIEELTRERWVELDRPPAARVTHAVALRPKSGDASAARRAAEAVAEAVREIREPEAFLRAARAVKPEGVTIRAERLPAMTADGRGFTFDGGARAQGSFDATFAEQANRLREPGEQSGIVETRFGFHVLLLEAKIPELHVPLDDRARALGAEILARRAGALRRELVERLSAETRVALSRDAEAQTARFNGNDEPRRPESGAPPR